MVLYYLTGCEVNPNVFIRILHLFRLVLLKTLYAKKEKTKFEIPYNSKFSVKLPKKEIHNLFYFQ